MVKLLIIADDFTGALDTAIQFVKKGIKTLVFTGTEMIETKKMFSAKVLVVDAQTRPMNPAQAYETVRELVSQAIKMGVNVIYKKTDSALRGNVGSELSAVLDGVGKGRVHFIPAFPAMKRVTKDGIQYIDGVRLEESSFRKDPFDPMDCSSVQKILSNKTSKKVTTISIGEEIPPMEEEKEILVYDASEDEDIKKRILELKRCDELHLLAGCAGFASFLPDILGLTGECREEIFKTDCFFVSCGSLNPITREQILYAQEHGFYRVSLSPEQKLWPEYYETENGRIFLNKLANICRNESCVEVDCFELEGTDIYAQSLGLSDEQIRFAVSACHGKIVRSLLERHINMTVLMTGGDTLMGFMRELGVCQLIPVAEVGPGIVLSHLEWKGEIMQVISKSGGFGDESVLVQVACQVIQEKKVKALA